MFCKARKRKDIAHRMSYEQQNGLDGAGELMKICG
jgi:hypothetical protein